MSGIKNYLITAEITRLSSTRLLLYSRKFSVFLSIFLFHCSTVFLSLRRKPRLNKKNNNIAKISNRISPSAISFDFRSFSDFFLLRKKKLGAEFFPSESSKRHQTVAGTSNTTFISATLALVILLLLVLMLMLVLLKLTSALLLVSVLLLLLVFEVSSKCF